MLIATLTEEQTLLADAFEHLIHSTGRRFETTELRRTFHEVVVASPGQVDSNWARWMIEAGRSLGMKVDRFDESVKAAVDLAECGVTLMTWHAPSCRFLMVTRVDRSEVRALWCDAAELETGSSPSRLANLVAEGDSNRIVNWIAISDTRSDQGDRPHGHHLTPLARFRSMLKPEITEIGILLILGMVIGLLATAVPIAGQQLVRAVTFGTLYQPIIVLSLMLLLFLGFMGALQALTVFVVELIQQRLFARMVAELSLHLPKANYQALRQANGPELVNRFLEIATVQKVVAGLLVDGLAVLLTTVIGMSLLAFYHPFLLGYDLLLLGLLTFVIFVLGMGGTETAVRESIQKYRVVAWLEEMARCPLAFRLAGGAEFAIARADRLTGEYLTARQRHFRVLLRQIVSLFALQALASTALLGLGGYLVMHEQLTLGQLVAAELIVTMIVGSFAKLSKHIEGYFDLMAAMDKLGHLIDLPSERTGHSPGSLPRSPLLELSGTQFLPKSRADEERPFRGELQNLRIEIGQHLAIYGGSGAGKSRLADRLYGLESADGGQLKLSGDDVRDLAPEFMRRNVALIRGIEVFAGTLEENIHLGRTEIHGAAVREALSLVCLDQELAAFPDGLLTELTCEGSPLTDSQQVRLMIARAVAGRPRLLVIDGLLDRLSDDLLHPLMMNLQDVRHSWTLLVLTGRQDVARLMPRHLDLIPRHSLPEVYLSHPTNDHLS